MFARMLVTTAAVLLALTGAAHAAERPSPDKVIMGERLAQEYCGGCHAIAAGPSPLADAPPFRDIHKRYRAGGLPQLLQEGMLEPTSLPEEGSPRRHPRMPMAALGVDQTAELSDYMKSLERPPRSHRHGR